MRRGTRVASAYIAATVDGSGINEEIVDSVEEAADGIDKAGKDHGDRYGDSFSEGFLSRMRNRVASRLSSSIGAGDAGNLAGDEAGTSFVDRMTDKVSGLGDKIRDELSDRLASNPEQVRRGIDRAFDDEFADRLGDRFASRLILGIESRFGDLDLSSLMTKAVSGNGKGGRSDSGLGGVIGKLFGAGSRNNFLNIFGRSMGGVVTSIEKASQFATGFADGLSKAADSAGMVSRLMAGLRGGAGASGLASAFARIGAAGPVAVGAIGAVIISLSVMASVAGALVGILTALASTIATALVGALLIAGPLLAAFATAAGLVTIAFTSMTNAQRDYLFSAFQPFKAAVTGIGQIIFREFTQPLYNGRSAIQVWSANLQRALIPLAGVAKTTAGAFAQAGNTITAALSGPGFQRFFTVLGRELPAIVRNMASALGSFLNGMAGVFAAVLPYVTQFSRYLAAAAEAFSKWANSAKGQNAIEDFVGRAVNSIKSLWGFIREFSGFVFDVLFSPAAQNAGNTIFDGLRTAFAKFRKAISNGDLERWFNDAIEFGGKMWSVMSALAEVFFTLYNSGVLDAVGIGFSAFATIVDAANTLLTPLIESIGWALPSVIATALTPLMSLAAAIIALGEGVEWLAGLVGIGDGAEDPWRGFTDIKDMWTDAVGSTPPRQYGPWAPGTAGNPTPYSPDFELPQFALPDLISSGNNALNNTYEQYGGYMPDPTDPDKGKKRKKKMGMEEWTNPYVAYAESLIKQGPQLADEIRAAAREARNALSDALNESTAGFRTLLADSSKSLTTGVTDAMSSTDAQGIFASWNAMVDQVTSNAASAMEQASASAQAMLDQAYATRNQMIGSAEAAVQAAAQQLANATTKKDVKKAQEALNRARKDLDIAYTKGEELIAQANRDANALLASANASQAQIDSAVAIIRGQSLLDWNKVNSLVAGLGAENATILDYAEARRQVAERLADASQGLIDAINLRNGYNLQVADSVRAFGSLLSAQAKTVNGVEQALTATDITESMRDRLGKARKFQEDLRQLLALGLSDSAYKQLVDAGVEQGGAYAEAILAGGQGSVSEVNNLTSQIDKAAMELGTAASSKLYQAGVDAAQGLVDGLTSLSAELDSAATALGNSIAAAIKSALGIASPSRVLMSLMDNVGDGAVIGLDNQHIKVGSAAARLAGQIAVSPEVASYAAQQGQPSTIGTADEVSGNVRPLIDVGGLHVHTPTEDPKAVATEAINELVGRIT